MSDILENIAKRKSANVESQAPLYTGESQFGRTALGGLTLGFWDEIEAAARTAVNGFADYEQVRDEIRGKMKAYQEANPGVALTAEVIGAAAPTALMMLVPGGQAAGVANIARMTSGQLIKRGAGVGAVEGGATAYGTGEDGALEDLTRIPGGIATGAATSAVLGFTGQKLSGSAGDFMQFLRRKLQGRPTGAVQAEIQRLVQLTGKSEDDIINDIINGRIMADEPNLAATLREYRSQGATVGRGDGDRQGIFETTQERALQTRGEATSAIQEGMTPGMDESVFKAFKESDAAFAKREGDAYKQIFSGAGGVSRETVDAMTEAFARVPDLAKKLQERYKVKGGIVPFYDEKLLRDTGELRIIRQPTIEDAEILRRTVQNEVDNAFSPTSTVKDIGPDLKAIEQKLRANIDADAPELAQTRANWSRLSQGRKAFDDGNKAWNQNVDEVAFNFDKLDDAAKRAYRAGAMNALRQRIKKSPITMRKLSTEGSAENEMLRTLFPGENVDDVIRKAGLAADVRAVSERVNPMGQSVTADQLAAREAQGTGPMGAMDIMGAATLDPQSLARVGNAIAGSFKVQLSPAQRNQVVDLLFETDPQIVEKALRGGGFTERQMENIGRIVTAVVEGGRSAATRQTGELGGNISERYIQGVMGP